MSRTHISAELRQLVRQRARLRCEYCLVPELVGFFDFEVDHIIAQKHGGPTTPENLAWSCALCNNRKGTDIASIDPQTQARAFLFHPRRDDWADHFTLEHGLLQPRTTVARATIHLLVLNDPQVIEIRRMLVQAGIAVD
ncbi:MAG: HNH endonuclease signature motif containing protein [Phycisphaeraceae bacterium]